MAGTTKLAWRNLGRNRRRTFITSVALAVGISLSVASYGLMDGMVAELLGSLTGFDLGHVQAHHSEFSQRRRMRDTVPHADVVVEQARALGEVRGVTTRLYGYGLVSHGNKSLGVELVGVDPGNEPKVTTLHEELIRGAYLDIAPTPWPRGRKLSAAELADDAALTADAEAAAIAEIEALASPASSSDGAADETEARDKSRSFAMLQSPPPARALRVIVGESLAKTLRLGVGTTVHATGQAVDGTNVDVDFEVVGVFKTGTARFDRSRIYMNLEDLQHFTRLYGRVHEVAILSDSPKDANALAARIRRRVAAQLGPGANGTKSPLIQSWSELRPDVKNMLDISKVSTGVMIFIILFVATLGVVNTMLMSVFERTRELGVLKALGMSGGRIVTLIATETLLLVLMSSIVGTAIGLLIDWYMVVHGVDMRSLTSGFSIGGVGLNPVLHGDITAIGVVLPTIILATTSLIASLYPGIRAARLEPAVGMRAT